MNIATRSDIGIKYSNNEDYVGYKEFEDITVLAIADGIGGEACGEYASKLAVDSILELCGTELAGNFSSLTNDDIKSRYNEFFDKINKKILLATLENPELKGTGSTLTVVTIFNRSIYITHIGDSRAYLLHGASITQLTKDHSESNRLTKSLGVNEFLEPDFYCYNIIYGDVILMCTDGIHSVVTNREILPCVKKHNDLEGGLTNLFNKAYECGSEDNITALLAHIRPS